MIAHKKNSKSCVYLKYESDQIKKITTYAVATGSKWFCNGKTQKDRIIYN